MNLRPAVVATTAVLLSSACASVRRPTFFGEWRVASFAAPGISALTSEQASSWIGTSATYGEALASFGDAQCTGPSYVRHTLSTADFFIHYHVAAAALGLVSEPIEIVEVKCDGLSPGRGDRLIVRSADALLTPWDGVFFELGRR